MVFGGWVYGDLEVVVRKVVTRKEGIDGKEEVELISDGYGHQFILL